MAEAESFDYIVIGGGSGGSGTARRAAGVWGKKTLLVENGLSGGCCVNVGCVPKKITYNLSHLSSSLHASPHYGFTPSSPSLSYPIFKAKRDAHIKHLNAIYERNWSSEGITLVHGTASFISPTTITVAPSDGSPAKTYTAKHICIATGSYPLIPPETEMPGSKYGITNEGFFELEELPKTIAIVGAGYIAVEIAGMLKALGSEVHLFIRGDSVLRRFDPMVQEAITKRYEEVGIKIWKGFGGFDSITSLSTTTDQSSPPKLLLKWNSGANTLEASSLLWAIGRAPYTSSLNLSAAGVTLGQKGHITVDEYQNTSTPGIYAIGDVTGQMELTPVAIASGRQLSNRLFGPPSLSLSKLSYDLIPSIIFSHPPIGILGLTTPAAETLYGSSNIKTYTTSFTDLFYEPFPPSPSQGEKPREEKDRREKTNFKIVCEGPEERIVGLHLVGRGVEEMLQGFAVAVKMGARKKDFDNCVAIHPTAAEEVVTMR